MEPTFAPIPFDPMGTCTYEKCETVSESCDCGSQGCPTSWGQTSGCTRESQSCAIVPVEPFSSSSKYAAGDFVRVGAAKFKCKEFPYEGWCSMAAYQPTLENGIWTDAWQSGGMCERVVTMELSIQFSMTLHLESCPTGAEEIDQGTSALESAVQTTVQESLEDGQSVTSVEVTSFECTTARRGLVSWLRNLQSVTPSEAHVNFKVGMREICIGDGCDGDAPFVAKALVTGVNFGLQEAVRIGRFDDALAEAAQDSGPESFQSAHAESTSWGVAEGCSSSAGGGSDGATSTTSACDFSMVSMLEKSTIFSSVTTSSYIYICAIHRNHRYRPIQAPLRQLSPR